MTQEEYMIQELSHYQFSPESQYLDRKYVRKKCQNFSSILLMLMVVSWLLDIEDEKQGNIITGFKEPEHIQLMILRKLTVRCMRFRWGFII